MTGPAIILMVVAILVIWGGLVGSVIALQIMPPPYEQATETDDASTQIESKS